MNMKDIKSYFVTLVNYETDLISERYEYLSDRNPVQVAELDLTFQKSHCDILGHTYFKIYERNVPLVLRFYVLRFFCG